jgi:superfamily II DNA or RNA helicase
MCLLLLFQYMLPATVHINNQEHLLKGDGPIVLVLAPTRELAQQIQTIAQRFGSSSYIRNTCIFGGASRGPQVSVQSSFRSFHVDRHSPLLYRVLLIVIKKQNGSATGQMSVMF